MAVAVDASATAPTIVGTATTSTTLTTLTVGASATALLAVVNSNNNLASLALTWDNGGTNQAMTLVGSANISSGWVWIFGLVNPTPGAKTLRASWTGSLTCILDALSFTGTATDTVANAFKNFSSATPAASTSHTITLTGASGNISFCTSANNTNTYTSPYLNTTGSTNLYHDATHVAGTSAYAPSASSVVWTDHTSSSLADVLAGVDVSAPSGNSASGSNGFTISAVGSAQQSNSAAAAATFFTLTSTATISDWATARASFLPLSAVASSSQYDNASSTVSIEALSASGQAGQRNLASAADTFGAIQASGAASQFDHASGTAAFALSASAAAGSAGTANAVISLLSLRCVATSVVSISAFLRTPVGPQTPWHFAPNANWPSNFDPNLQTLGFTLADVASAGLLPFLPSGVKALVYVGNPNGVDTTFTTLMSACAPYINSIFAFYLADTADPDPSGTWGTFYDPANLKAQADYIHTNFPGTKTFIWIANLGSSYAPAYDQYNGFTGYLPSNTDIDYYGIDGYPVRDDLNGGFDTSILALNFNAAVAAGIPADAIVPSYQAFGLGDWGAPFEVPTQDQLRQTIAAWRPLTPNPPFDYYFAWGEQKGDIALKDLPSLQVVAQQSNEPSPYVTFFDLSCSASLEQQSGLAASGTATLLPFSAVGQVSQADMANGLATLAFSSVCHVTQSDLASSSSGFAFLAAVGSLSSHTNANGSVSVLSLSAAGHIDQHNAAISVATMLPLACIATSPDWCLGTNTILTLSGFGFAGQGSVCFARINLPSLTAIGAASSPIGASGNATVLSISAAGSVSTAAYGRASVDISCSASLGQSSAVVVSSSIDLSAAGQAVTRQSAVGSGTFPVTAVGSASLSIPVSANISWDLSSSGVLGAEQLVSGQAVISFSGQAALFQGFGTPAIGLGVLPSLFATGQIRTFAQGVSREVFFDREDRLVYWPPWAGDTLPLNNVPTTANRAVWWG